MYRHVIKINKIVRASGILSLNLLCFLTYMRSGLCPDRAPCLLAFFFPVSIRTRISLLESHGEKCEREGKKATTERKVMS